MLNSPVIALLHLLKNRFLGQSVGRKTVSLLLDTTQEPAKGMCAPPTKISYRLRSDLLTWSCAGTALQIQAGPAIPTVQLNTMVIVQRAQILCHPARHCRQLFSITVLLALPSRRTQLKNSGITLMQSIKNGIKIHFEHNYLPTFLWNIQLKMEFSFCIQIRF